MTGNTAPAQAAARLPTSQVVHGILRERLMEVLRRLAPAVERWEETPEHVHQMRVAARRAVAAIDVFRPLLPRKRARRLRRGLQRVRRESDRARDCDVLRALLSAETADNPSGGLRERIESERAAAQHDIARACGEFDSADSLEHRITELIARVRWRQRKRPEPPFGSFAVQRIRKPARRFFQAAGDDFQRIAALHRFRIRGKQFRYSLELLGAGLASKPLGKLHRQLSRLQDRLGAVNDRATAAASLRRWIGSLADEAQAAPLRALLAVEEPALDAARRRFKRWWSAKRSRQLRKAFRRLT